MTEGVTKQEIEIIRHAIGATEGRRPYRNHYAAESGSPDYATCEALVGRGLMKKGASLGYGDYFHVTRAGYEMVGHEAP